MKKLAYLIPFLFLACSKDKDPKEVLSALKTQKADIEKQIETLEKEVNKNGGKKLLKALYVKSEEVKLGSFSHFLEVQGKVESNNNINLSPKVAGQITKIAVVVGANVKKGTLIATLDATPLLKGKAELQSGLDLATTVFDKTQKLWDEKIGTELQYLQAKQTKEGLEKKMSTLNEQISYCRIVAPISGTIEMIIAKEGEMAAPGAPVVRIAGSGDFKATAEIAESYVGTIRSGNAVQLSLPDMNQTTNVVIRSVGQEINPMTRTFKIETTLGNLVSSAKANMILYMKIEDYKNASVISIPINVVQKSDEGNFVYVDEAGFAIKKLVKVGKAYMGNIEVLSGLKAGDKLITVAYQELVEGQPIKY